MFDSENEMSNLFDEINSYLENPSAVDKPGILSEPEIERLILAFGSNRGEKGFTEDEVVALVEWASLTRIANTMLEMVLDGSCDVDWLGTEPAMRLTRQGAEELSEINADDL
jgi:hypothetical protein